MPVHRECPSPIVRPSSNGERCADRDHCSDGERRSHGKNGAEGTERVEWLWPGRLALGQLTILTGGTMSGKSFLSADLAARVTNGFEWPDAIGDRADAGNGEIPPNAKPARVLIVPGNPSRARRLWPRLAAAGADLDRVVVDQADRSKIPNDEIVASIDEALTRAGDCKLVIFEPPPLAFASRGAELDEECVAFFQSLANLAARRELAVLVVVGLRHDFSAPVSKRQLGALASCGAAMSVWALLRDEATPELRYLVAARSTEADDQTAMAFRVRQDRSCASSTAARVEWRADVLATADGASRAFGGAAASRRAVRIDAMRWLKSLLLDGGMPVTEIQREARGAGYSWATVRRAQQELPVSAHREYYDGSGHWLWEMEADAWIAGQNRVASDKKPRHLDEFQLINMATMLPVGELPVIAADGPADDFRSTDCREVTDSRTVVGAAITNGRPSCDGDPTREQGAQLVRQGAQLAGQGAQLAREISGRLTPAARPDQDAQPAHENGRPAAAGGPLRDQGAQLAGQGAQLARQITGRLTPAARPDQGAQLARENGRLAVASGPLPDQGAQLAGQGAQLAREITGRLTPAARLEQSVQLARENGRLAVASDPPPEQGAQLAGQGAQLAREITGRLTPAARPDQGVQPARENGRLAAAGDPPPDQGAQLAGQGAQLAREITGRLTSAARPDLGAQPARENGRPAAAGGLPPDQGAQLADQGAQLAGQGAQLAEQGAQLARENGRPAVTGGPRRDSAAAAKARRMKRKEKKRKRRLVAIGLER
ncbi:MAG TPA: AAA family ATPase [Pirellulales bacterium]|nr:AAA family ATPase [Pirellulales bacterium]